MLTVLDSSRMEAIRMGSSSSRFAECIMPYWSFGSDREGGQRRKHQRRGREEKEGDCVLGKEGGSDERRRRTTACWGVREAVLGRRAATAM
jgi:hypothetical protein